MRSNSRRRNYAILAAAAMAALAIAYWWHSRTGPADALREKSATLSDAGKKIALSRQQETRQAAPSKSPAFAIAEDGTVPVPARFQLPGVPRVRAGTAASFQEWIGLYPEADQAAIRDFNAKHFGVYSINSPQQIAWMAQNGYPMPEDLIAAKALTDEDLRRLAQGGNDKAGFLLRERDIETLRAALQTYAAQGNTDSDFWLNDPAAEKMRQDDDLYRQLLRQSNSPFKGYLQAQESLLTKDPLEADADVIAGLAWAMSLGDFRASQLMTNFEGNDSIRVAMFMAAAKVSSNKDHDIMRMRETGCAPAGVGPGMYIPGDFGPVE
jgi:hypothetical protein